ncbi:MAG: transcriptional regulator [Candidatus Micrarchaeia archaeon]
MCPTLLELAAESKVINQKLFLLPRLLILSALSDLPPAEIATFRELKALLGLNDGVLYSNLKILASMGYIREQKVELFKFEETGYGITAQGRADFAALATWLQKWEKGRDGHGKLGESNCLPEGTGHKAKTD